jgi:hypothetical protein
VTAKPWARGEWHGLFVSVDGTATDDFTEADIDHLVVFGTTPSDEWDGDEAGVVLLRDGRYASWESSWGPTGSGFSADAYGGEADIFFAATLPLALSPLSERSLELLWAGDPSLERALDPADQAAYRVGGWAAFRTGRC